MKLEIETYLKEYGDRYTSEALRAQLVEAGHDPAEVDAALGEWAARRSSTPPTDEGKRQFRRLTWLIHGAALLIAFLWMLLVIGGDLGAILIVSAVLGIVLLIGVGISLLIGRFLVSGATAGAALVVPVVTALLIAGSCVGLMGGLRI